MPSMKDEGYALWESVILVVIVILILAGPAIVFARWPNAITLSVLLCYILLIAYKAWNTQ